MRSLCLIFAPLSCVFVTIPNVLANRYASAEMVAIWSP
jgi:adenylosuccinate lyase